MVLKRKLLLLLLDNFSIFFLAIDIPMLPVPEDQDYNDVIWNGFELDRDQITLVRILGTGNFGHVFKATYGDSRLEVAVKSLKGILLPFPS